MSYAPSITQVELEGRIVGALLARGDALYELPAAFGPQAFRSDTLRRTFEAVERLGKAKRLPAGRLDIPLVLSEARLPDAARAELGMAEAQADASDRAPIADNARALLERHRRAALAEHLQGALAALRGEASTEEIAGRVTARLLDLDRGEVPETRTLREVALTTLDLLEKQKAGGQVLPTGIPDLDKVLKIRKTNLVVLAARAGEGKSTLAMQIADHVSSVVGKHVLVHALEMSAEEDLTLVMARAAEVDSQSFWDESPWDAGAWTRISAELDRRLPGDAADGRMHFNDAHHTLGAILRISEKMHRKHGLGLIVVDYLQLVEVDLGKNSNREQQVAYVTRSLKHLSMRLGVPVLACAQLNREVEKRATSSAAPKCRRCGSVQAKHYRDGDHIFEPPAKPAPKLHDLRESGAIEQDANAVLLLHNPEADHPDAARRLSGPFELIVAKQRLGRKGKAYLVGDLKYARFRAATRDPAKPWQDGG